MTEFDAQSRDSEQAAQIEASSNDIGLLTDLMVELYRRAVELNQRRNAVVKGDLEMDSTSFELLKQELVKAHEQLNKTEMKLRRAGKNPRQILNSKLSKPTVPSQELPDAELLGEIADHTTGALLEQRQAELKALAELSQAQRAAVEAEAGASHASIVDELTGPDREMVAASDETLLNQLEAERRQKPL